MCDRRIRGRKIKNDVKFIAACNPYRKLVPMFSNCCHDGITYADTQTQ